MRIGLAQLFAGRPRRSGLPFDLAKRNQVICRFNAWKSAKIKDSGQFSQIFSPQDENPAPILFLHQRIKKSQLARG